MIPIILTMLWRRYKKIHPEGLPFSVLSFYLLRFLLMLIMLTIFVWANAQGKRLDYTIKRNGKAIGDMHIKEVREGSRISLRLESKVKASFIFSFTANGIEEALYENGILLYSFVYQMLNGNEKLNKKTKLVDSNYVVNNKGTEEKLERKAIYYNMVCVYTHEPVDVRWIYSDKFQTFIGILKLEDHHYKIKFPDGNSNEYFYKEGVCNRVELNTSLYSATMELKS
jgi:hypothetical protein